MLQSLNSRVPKLESYCPHQVQVCEVPSRVVEFFPFREGASKASGFQFFHAQVYALTKVQDCSCFVPGTIPQPINQP